MRGSRIVCVIRKELSVEDSLSRDLTREREGPGRMGEGLPYEGIALLSPAPQPAGHQVLTSVLMSSFLPSLSLLPTLYLLSSSSCHSCVHGIKKIP